MRISRVMKIIKVMPRKWLKSDDVKSSINHMLTLYLGDRMKIFLCGFPYRKKCDANMLHMH